MNVIVIWPLFYGACKIIRIFGAFAKLRKAIISFFMSVFFVRLPVWNNSVPTGRVFIKFGISVSSEILLTNFKFHLKIRRIIMGTLNGNVSTEISETVVAGKIKTHFMFSTYLLTYLLTPWCRVLLEKLTSLHLVKIFPAFHGT